ncbi:MAG: 3-hydroxyacyl-CoA dehydrogenase NAD-binding domain-containing protein [Pirellulales bacterium]
MGKQMQGLLIVGAGWIGRQVALRTAICGLPVALLDKSPAVLSDARSWMQTQAPDYLRTITDESRTIDLQPLGTFHFDLNSAMDWQDRLSFSEKWESNSAVPAVVLECVPEQVAIKRRVLKEFSETFDESVIIASNSSYFTPGMLKRYVVHPQRFAHWHFHVPLERSSIADVSPAEETGAWVVERLVELSVRIGQYPLVLRHEHSGYVFNWLLQSVLRGALELAAEDVVDPREIDRAWVAVSKMPIGPFAMMDHIGLDVIEQVLSNARWADERSVPIDSLLAILKKPIEQGHLGIKSGEGFYKYKKEE